MRILHYALGFPPYRSGGLTKWCVDLMIQQAKEGHCVAMLWPGQMGMLNKKIAIKKQEDVCLKEQTTKYINWYNYVRPHSHNNYLTPMEARYK